MSGEKSTDELIMDLLSSVVPLQNDTTALKQRRMTNRTASNFAMRMRRSMKQVPIMMVIGNDSNAERAELDDKLSTESKWFKLFKECEAFLKTIFGSFCIA